MSWDLPIEEIAALQELAGCPVVVLLFARGETLSYSEVEIVYECLLTLGKMQSALLVLQVEGGHFCAARRLALLLHSFCPFWTVCVPHKARSAGTFLALAGNEIIMGRLAELGPLDAQILASDPQRGTGPMAVSSEDLRLFARMATQWFHLDPADDKLARLEMICEKFYPTMLVSLFRANEGVVAAASDLLRFQLEEKSEAERVAVARRLTEGHPEHAHALVLDDVVRLGLRARAMSIAMETVCWQLLQKSRQIFSSRPKNGDNLTALLATSSFAALRFRIGQPEVLTAPNLIDNEWKIVSPEPGRSSQ